MRTKAIIWLIEALIERLKFTTNYLGVIYPRLPDVREGPEIGCDHSLARSTIKKNSDLLDRATELLNQLKERNTEMGNRSKRINPDTGLKAGPKRAAENHADKAKARAKKTRRWARIMGK